MSKLTNSMYMHRKGIALLTVGAVVVAGTGFIAVNSQEVVPTQTSESIEYYNNVDYDKVVNFYDDVCRGFTSLQSITDTVGEVSEDSLGDDPVDRVNAVNGSVLKVADNLDERSSYFASMPAPSVAILDRIEPADYTVASDEVSTTLRSSAHALRQAVRDNGPDNVTDENVDERVNTVTSQVAEVAGGGSEGMERVLELAPLPTEKSSTDVKSSPNCESLFSVPVVDPDKVHAPTVEFWDLLDQAHTELAEAMEVFATEESRAELTEYAQVADAYNHVGDVLASASQRFGAFQNVNGLDLVTEVVDAAGQAEERYIEMAGEMRRAADVVVTEDVEGASAIVNQVMVDEGSTQMRMHRLARPVNQPTADAVHSDPEK